jgi:hypothetical protein
LESVLGSHPHEFESRILRHLTSTNAAGRTSRSGPLKLAWLGTDIRGMVAQNLPYSQPVSHPARSHRARVAGPNRSVAAMIAYGFASVLSAVVVLLNSADPLLSVIFGARWWESKLATAFNSLYFAVPVTVAAVAALALTAGATIAVGRGRRGGALTATTFSLAAVAVWSSFSVLLYVIGNLVHS